jgi:hypothetical protein
VFWLTQPCLWWRDGWWPIIKMFFLMTHPFLWWRMDDLVDTRPGSPACCPFGAGPIWALTCPSSPSRSLSHQSAKKKVNISLKNNRSQLLFLLGGQRESKRYNYFLCFNSSTQMYSSLRKKYIKNWGLFLESRYDINCLC